MKKYDRANKSWLDAEEKHIKMGKRTTCKSGREHDWILCLPSYVHCNDSALGFDKVEEYYKIEDEREDSNIAFDERFEDIGVRSRLYHGTFGRRRSYICSVCMKQK